MKLNDEIKSEIILYQPEETTKIEVVVENDTVWLTQQQMAELFQNTKQNISFHISNIFKEKELPESSTVKYSLTVQQEGRRIVKRSIAYYNLDVIISVGYRVKSKRGTDFRIWANGILKEYLLKGYSMNYRIEKLEKTVAAHSEKIDFFVRSSLPPVEGIFYEGQIFDAYAFASNLIKSAKKYIVLIDNYIDESVLMMLSKRNDNVKAIVYTGKITSKLQLDIDKHNAQYAQIEVVTISNVHDRFMIIDETTYHLGASIKDLGKKLFAFSKMNITPEVILKKG